MGSHDYEFLNHWRVQGALDEVSEILGEQVDFPRWWPAFCLGAERVAPNDAQGVGGIVKVHVRGWMPYTLRWQMTAVETVRPHRFVVDVTGELEGRGVWTLAREGADVTATLDWRVRGNFPFFNCTSAFLRPLFRSNHDWAMTRGEESLRLELQRRHCRTDEERARVARPHLPTWPQRRAWEKKFRAAGHD